MRYLDDLADHIAGRGGDSAKRLSAPEAQAIATFIKAVAVAHDLWNSDALDGDEMAQDCYEAGERLLRAWNDHGGAGE